MRPALSVTVRVTGYVPGELNVCPGATPLAEAPSPKLQLKLAIEPSASEDAAPLKATALPAVAVLGENENSAVGISSTSTRCVAVAIGPEPSLTRRWAPVEGVLANTSERAVPWPSMSPPRWYSNGVALATFWSRPRTSHIKAMRRTVETALTLRQRNRQPGVSPPPGFFTAPRTPMGPVRPMRRRRPSGPGSRSCAGGRPPRSRATVPRP